MLFGTAVLSFNFANEYFALNGETPLSALPSVQSMLRRTGQNEHFNAHHADRLAWPAFLEEQFTRLDGIFLPYALHGAVEAVGLPGGLIGILGAGACLIGLLFVRQKLLWTSLALAGFCWALPMRHNVAFHDYEVLFFIGLPLLLFSMGLSYLHRLAGERLIAGLATVALLIFVVSSVQMSRVGYDAEAAGVQEAMMADFEGIRRMTEGKSVFVPPRDAIQFAGVRYALDYYLAGRVLVSGWSDSGAADFLVSHHRFDAPALLTPENRQVFLYRTSDFSALIDEMIGSSEPVIRHRFFEVYHNRNRLIYVRTQSGGQAARLTKDTPLVGEPFVASLAPPIRLALASREPWQWERFSAAEGWTTISAPTLGGSYAYTPTPADVGQRLRASVYYTPRGGNRGKALTLPSAPVQPSGGFVRFFLHVDPVDLNDLPDHRKQYGFDNLDFHLHDFSLPDLPRERFIAVRALPAYDIARIRTGQYTAHGRLWEAEGSFEE